MTCRTWLNFRHFNTVYPKLILFAFVWMIPFTANSADNGVIEEKRMAVVMRTIGHEVLVCMGDLESRVMPIEHAGPQYRISFESQFGFNPDDIVTTVDRVMKAMSSAHHYLVEVEQCETKEVVHSFEINTNTYTDLLACDGRLLPKDCYHLLITILEDIVPRAQSPARTSNSSSLMNSENKKSHPFKSAFLLVPLLILLGGIGYFIRKKTPSNQDPNLISIGGSLFNKRNMTLSFEEEQVELSNKEAELLKVLHASVNLPLEREVILQSVWGDEGDYVGRTLDVFISKLRKKLEPDTSVRIVNIRGIGYKLIVDAPA